MSDIFKLLKTQSEQLVAQTEQLAAVTASMKKVDLIEAEVKNIKTLVVALTEENKDLRAALKLKDEQIDDMQVAVTSLESKLNNLEQHHRGWGARVLNVPVSEAEEADPEAVIEKVYQLALLPILQGAARKGKLQNIPTADQVLEVAHVLPGKPGQHKPIIMRFYNRNLRNIIFQHKREFATREPNRGAGAGGGVDLRGAGAGEGAERLGRFRYPLYDDLTKVNLAKMRAISQDERVQSCWTVSGQIRYKLHDSNIVKKVANVFEPIDKILK